MAQIVAWYGEEPADPPRAEADGPAEGGLAREIEGLDSLEKDVDRDWAGLVGIGGFLGGFATLVARMRPGGDEDDEDDELPGGGAVVWGAEGTASARWAKDR